MASIHAPLPDPLFGWVPLTRQWAPSLRYLLRRDRILAALPERGDGDCLLEVGCGAGALLVELHDRGYRCVGLESSEGALAIARDSLAESGRDVRLVATAEIDWAGRFNMVMAFDVLEHIEDDLGALQQWSKWLMPGGRVMLTVPAHQAKWGAGDVWAGHFRRYERAGLVAKLQAGGLQADIVECYGFPLANITEFLGEWHYRKELKRRASAGHGGRAEGNALSGVDRSVYRRALPLIMSAPGRVVLRLGQWLQRRTIQTDWGSGYLVVARKQ